jgi:hypothetical protein
MHPTEIIFKDILFKEYDTLRAEIISRTNSGYQLLALFAGAVSWLVLHPKDRMFWLSLVVLLLGSLVITLVIWRDTYLLAT